VAVVSGVENARREWEDGHRRLRRESGDRLRYERLMEQVEAVTAELRRRVGQTFTLAQLADAYPRAEAWSREAIEERAPYPGWVRTAADVEAAAFYLYARGAQDYEP
jgi:hypothetical protein